MMKIKSVKTLFDDIEPSIRFDRHDPRSYDAAHIHCVQTHALVMRAGLLLANDPPRS